MVVVYGWGQGLDHSVASTCLAWSVKAAAWVWYIGFGRKQKICGGKWGWDYSDLGSGRSYWKMSWSMLGHVLSKEQSQDGSDRASDDGHLTIVQCHSYHQPAPSTYIGPLSDLYLVMPKFSFELMQEPRTKRTKLSVQIQFSLVHGFWAVSSVLGSMIVKFLRTGFKPVQTKLSVHIFF